MKQLNDGELLNLAFGSKIRVVWHNSSFHNKNDEYYGVVFGDMIGYKDGLIDSLKTIAECVYNNWCKVYLIIE